MYSGIPGEHFDKETVKQSDGTYKIQKQTLSESDICQISIKDITDFKWDRMAIYQVGSSKVEITKALGVEYKGSTDLMSGIIFVYKNKIVHEEKVSYNPEKPSKLAYVIEKQQQESNCISYTLEDALFNGSREKIDGVFYYKITATAKKYK